MVCTQREMKYRTALSLDSKKHFERYRSYSLIEGEQKVDLDLTATAGNAPDETDANDTSTDDTDGREKATDSKCQFIILWRLCDLIYTNEQTCIFIAV